ncbi:MAG: hypothetical protein RBS88_08250 [Spongiibacteraceae bacterium]|jgi:hypothetical protein|nr:hypothetical protein [Spongiibacteraceae bacterium]
MTRHPYDTIPDARDGLSRLERIVLHVLNETQRELNGRAVPTAMLYGRVVEYINISVGELHACLDRLGVRGHQPGYHAPGRGTRSPE